MLGSAADRHWDRCALVAVAAGACAATVASGCDLDAAGPDVVTTEEARGPVGVRNRIHGLVGDLAAATENAVLYGGLFTDEFIHAGTFPTRLQVDERRVLSSNVTVSAEVEVPLQVARAQGERMLDDFRAFLDDGDFDREALRDGIAIAHFVVGLSRLWLGELWCEAALGPGAEPVPSDEAVGEALTAFEAAEGAALEAGLPEWADAARLGRARSHLWLGDFEAAGRAAAAVDRAHRLWVEYSDDDPEQYNRVHDVTHGSRNAVIRWTVGDGGQVSRGNERFAEYDEFVELGLVVPSPDPDEYHAFDQSIAVHLQRLYDEPEDDVLVSAGPYARLIEAEAMVRRGAAGVAAEIIDDVRGDFVARWAAERFRIDAEIETIDERADAEFGGDFENLTTRQQLLLLTGEYAREGWLAATRQENLRRLVEEFGAGTAMDLYPEKPGDQICWPVSEREETGGTP